MLTLPRQPPTVAWHQQSAWRTYAQQLFGLVSRRRDFHAEFRTGELIAGVIPQQKRLIVNPQLIPAVNTHGASRYSGASWRTRAAM